MKTFLLMAALATYGGVMAGCQSSNESNPPQKTTDNTMNDPSGNVMSHPESQDQTGNVRTNSPANNNNPNTNANTNPNSNNTNTSTPNP